MTNTPPNASNTMPDAVKHTPGPWLAVGGMVEHPDDRTADICDCYPGRFGQPILGRKRSHDEVCANARLIAAAPELLTELEYAVRLLAPLMGGTAQVQRMRQVIAKARGE